MHPMHRRPHRANGIELQRCLLDSTTAVYQTRSHGAVLCMTTHKTVFKRLELLIQALSSLSLFLDEQEPAASQTQLTETREHSQWRPEPVLHSLPGKEAVFLPSHLTRNTMISLNTFLHMHSRMLPLSRDRAQAHLPLFNYLVETWSLPQGLPSQQDLLIVLLPPHRLALSRQARRLLSVDDRARQLTQGQLLHSKGAGLPGHGRLHLRTNCTTLSLRP